MFPYLHERATQVQVPHVMLLDWLLPWVWHEPWYWHALLCAAFWMINGQFENCIWFAGGTFALYSLICRFAGMRPATNGVPDASDVTLSRYRSVPYASFLAVMWGCLGFVLACNAKNMLVRTAMYAFWNGCNACNLTNAPRAVGTQGTRTSRGCHLG